MGKHTPLPHDPTERAAEKKRRFAAYRRDWKKRRRAEAVRTAVSDAKVRRELLIEARQLSLDLCLSLDDMSERQLRKALQIARSWLQGAVTHQT